MLSPSFFLLNRVFQAFFIGVLIFAIAAFIYAGAADDKIWFLIGQSAGVGAVVLSSATRAVEDAWFDYTKSKISKRVDTLERPLIQQGMNYGALQQTLHNTSQHLQNYQRLIGRKKASLLDNTQLTTTWQNHSLDLNTFSNLTSNQFNNIRSPSVTQYLANGQLTYPQALNLPASLRNLLSHPQTQTWLNQRTLQINQLMTLINQPITLIRKWQYAANLNDKKIMQAVTQGLLTPLQVIQLHPYYREALRHGVASELIRQEVIPLDRFFEFTLSDLKKLSKITVPPERAARLLDSIGLAQFLRLSYPAIIAFNQRANTMTETNAKAIYKNELRAIHNAADLSAYLATLTGGQQSHSPAPSPPGV